MDYYGGYFRSGCYGYIEMQAMGDYYLLIMLVLDIYYTKMRYCDKGWKDQKKKGQ